MGHQMSFKNKKDSNANASKKSHDDINVLKRDVQERFLGILWKKEVDFNFSTK